MRRRRKAAPRPKAPKPPRYAIIYDYHGAKAVIQHDKPLTFFINGQRYEVSMSHDQLRVRAPLGGVLWIEPSCSNQVYLEAREQPLAR